MNTKRFQVNLKALEVSLYVICGGAFGVFTRWMQDMLAFDEEGLPTGGFWNFMLPVVIVAAAYAYYRFIRDFKTHRWDHEESFQGVFANPGKIFQLVRWALGVIMVMGSALLFAESAADVDIFFLRILSALGVISGICFPLFLGAANREDYPVKRLCLLATAPILTFCFWLVTLYKMNAYNSVVVGFGYEVIIICFVIVAFYRLAGFAFGRPDFWKTLFFCMLAAFLCISALADERYTGLQVMYLSSACMFTEMVWIMVRNMHQHKAINEPVVAADLGGFEKVI